MTPCPCDVCEAMRHGVTSVAPPLAGHAGDCAKVLHATAKGETDAACDCRTSSKAVDAIA